jgi:hypothetical protein
MAVRTVPNLAAVSVDPPPPRPTRRRCGGHHLKCIWKTPVGGRPPPDRPLQLRLGHLRPAADVPATSLLVELLPGPPNGAAPGAEATSSAGRHVFGRRAFRRLRLPGMGPGLVHGPCGDLPGLVGRVSPFEKALSSCTGTASHACFPDHRVACLLPSPCRACRCDTVEVRQGAVGPDPMWLAHPGPPTAILATAPPLHRSTAPLHTGAHWRRSIGFARPG